MSVRPKIVQLDMFINEKVEIENKINKECEESTKRQLRFLHYKSHETMRRLDKQEEIIQSLLEYILCDDSSEKTPSDR